MSNQFSQYLKTTELFDNSQFIRKEKYNKQHILSLSSFKKAFQEISSWKDYQKTPLLNLEKLAKDSGVSKIYYKDESKRFGLKSFKALGGAYAVANLLIQNIEDQIQKKVSSKDLLSGKYREITNQITVCCATDGNHGRSVAWGALVFGCNCEIFIHKDVSEQRKKAIEFYKANVTRINGNYDDSVRIAAETAIKNNYYIVSDTSYEGYTEVPKDVMQGYTIMVHETLEQIAKDKPTHVFLQGGVGGMAASVVSFLLETYQKEPPIFVVVEPKNADCLLQSAKKSNPTVVHGDLETIMAGLACGEVSVLAWEILKDKVEFFLSIEDQPIIDIMQILAKLDQPIIAGESAVAGLAGFLILQSKIEFSQKLNIDQSSKILIFGTEGDTDEEMYQKLVGSSSEEILSRVS